MEGEGHAALCAQLPQGVRDGIHQLAFLGLLIPTGAGGCLLEVLAIHIVLALIHFPAVLQQEIGNVSAGQFQSPLSAGDEGDVDHLAVHREYAHAGGALLPIGAHDLLRLENLLLGGSEDLMDESDLFGVDEALAVKAHGLVLKDLRFEPRLIVQIGEHGVEALDAGRAGRDQHLPPGHQHIHAIGLGLGLHALSEVAAGDGHAEHTGRSGADLIGVQDALGAFQGRHQERPTLLHAEFLLGGLHGLFHRQHILGAFTLGDADAVGPARHADPDILLPVGGVQAVDADDDLGAAVVDGFEGVIQGEAGGVLLILRHRVLQIQHDAVAAVDVGVLDEARLLRVHEHHGAAQPETFRFRSRDHLTAPPQGMSFSEASALRNTAHSTRALSVQSKAPLSTTVTRAFFTPRRSSVSNTVALICRPYWFMTLLFKKSSIPFSPGSTMIWASLDSSVPAMAGLTISNCLSSFIKYCL